MDDLQAQNANLMFEVSSTCDLVRQAREHLPAMNEAVGHFTSQVTQLQDGLEESSDLLEGKEENPRAMRRKTEQLVADSSDLDKAIAEAGISVSNTHAHFSAIVGPLQEWQRLSQF